MEAGREGGEDEAADRNDLKISDSADLLLDCGVKNFGTGLVEVGIGGGVAQPLGPTNVSARPTLSKALPTS